jgi:hypothetical protein
MPPKPSTSQARYEKEWLKKEMEHFTATDSDAWRLLMNLHGPKLSKDEVLSLGIVISKELDIELVREYKRRKETMIKWFQNNLERIEPFLREFLTIEKSA